jgi:hypothetical protein
MGSGVAFPGGDVADVSPLEAASPLGVSVWKLLCRVKTRSQPLTWRFAIG